MLAHLLDPVAIASDERKPRAGYIRPPEPPLRSGGFHGPGTNQQLTLQIGVLRPLCGETLPPIPNGAQLLL